MKPQLRFWACVIAGSLVGAPVSAQSTDSPQAMHPQGRALTHTQATSPTSAPPSATVPLREALDAAWARAVAHRESQGQRRRAEADRAAAGSLWAAPPSLEVSHRSDRLQRNVGSREIELGVAVPLWLPGQRDARAQTAEVALAHAQAAEQVARLRLAGELREIAWQIAALETEAHQVDAHALTLKQLSEDVNRRVRAGDLAPADALSTQAEVLATSVMQSDTRQRLQAARARWTLLTGLAAAPDLKSDADASVPPGVQPLHPELQLADVLTELARQRLELMRLSRREAPELTVGLRQDQSAREEASQGSLIVGLRLPLGTDGRNRPLEAAALAELDMAQTQGQRLRERFESEITSARDALRTAEEQLAAESSRARLLRERAALFEKSFQAGETPLPDLLRALADAAQADSAAARQTVALGWARARLQQTLGLFP